MYMLVSTTQDAISTEEASCKLAKVSMVRSKTIVYDMKIVIWC